MKASFAYDIPALLTAGMGPELHWFPEDVSPARLAAALTGMANANGGLVLLGVAPRSRDVHGIHDVAEVVDRVFQAVLLPDPPLVLPMPVLAQVAGGEAAQVLCVQVPAGLPHVYSLDGRYLGREGVQTNPLSARRLRQLLLERGVVQFESRVPPGVSWEDLDPQQVEAYLRAVNGHGLPLLGEESAQEALLRRGCLQRVDGTLRPTYAALLLFGRYPQQWLPNAIVLAAHFPGVAFADEFIKQEIRGTLPEQLRQAEAFVQANLRTRVSLVGLSRQETPEYPLEAVRELLVNAVAHRDYNIQGDHIHLHLFADRLEVHSPGGLPGPVTLENLLEARFSRNAVITQVLSDLGFVERLGYGLDRVMTVVRQNHLPPPRFEESAGVFRVTLYNDLPQASEQSPLPDLAEFAALDLNLRQKMAVAFLVRQKRITNRDFQELCPDVHMETLRRDLADMVSRGVLMKIGDKRATYYILKNIPIGREMGEREEMDR